MIRRLVRKENGTSAVEFALVAPILILIFMGIVEFGRYAYYAILASHAARAAASWGAQNGTTAKSSAGMQSIAAADATGLSNWTTTPGSISANPMCSVNGGALQACTGTINPANTVYYVQVSVTGQFNTLIRYPGIPSPVTVTGSSTMRVSGQ
ncbi:MAG: TadE/TadG family type IV pilus assembly protein [Candidatus Cybelea sp.]